MLEIVYKICIGCNKEKQISDFPFRKDRNAYRGKCSDCLNRIANIGYHEDKSYHQEYAKKNKDKNALHYQENKEEIREEHKKYYKDNIEKEKKRSKKYRENNKLSTQKRLKKYYQDNKKTIHEKQKNKRNNDIIFKLTCNLRGRLNKALVNNYKSGSAVRDLGCSINFLKGYLEAQWYANPRTGEMMTWENYGRTGWHVDHDRPLSSFDLSNREELLKAVHFQNLQPMWAEDNLEKGNKYV